MKNKIGQKFQGTRGINFQKSEEDNPYTEIRKKLNGMKQKSALVSALVTHPRLSSDGEKFKNALSFINDLHKNITDKVSKDLMANGMSQASRAEIATSTAFFLADIWKRHSKPEELTRDFLENAYLQTYKDVEPSPDNVFDEISDNELDVALAEGTAASRFVPSVLKIQNKGRAATLFINELKTDEVVQVLKDDLVKRSEEVLGCCVGKDQTKFDNPIAYKSILSSLARNYQPALNAEMDRLSQAFKNMSKDARSDFLKNKKQYKEGILINNVKTQMDSVQQTMSQIFLVRSQNEDSAVPSAA